MKNILLFAVLCAFVTCNAQESSTPSKESLDVFIKRQADSLFKSSNIPGLFIGVLDNGKRTYYNYGYADPATKMAFDSAVIFEAGSITKTFTALVLSMVLNDKNIDVNTPIVNYLPDSVKANKNLGHITFLKLMNHTSGLPRLPSNFVVAGDQPYKDYDVNKLFSYLKTAEPNTNGKPEYSNLGFGLAAVLAARIFDTNYDVLLGTYVLLPFKIMPSIKDLLIDDTKKKAQGYFSDRPVEFWEFDALGGAGEIKLNADQMLTYLDNISNPPIFKEVINKLLEPTASFGKNIEIGRAWVISETYDKPSVYWHNGGTYGFSTFGGFLKGQQQAVIIVVNKFNMNAISDQLGMKIMEKLRSTTP